MKIAVIGTRGIPNRYGGYEQFVEFAAPALVERGHEVYVYNSSRHPYKEGEWKRVRIIHKFDPEDKIGSAGQFIYDLNCILDARRRNFDIILQLGYTSSSIWSFLFPRRSLVITNMDGLEWKRSKYGNAVRQFLRMAEKWAALNSDFLIADSKGIQQYLLDKYHKPSTFIPYGAHLVTKTDESLLKEKNIEKHAYDLLIARMEPENNIETIIKGHLLSASTIPLLIIGNYKNKFGAFLEKKYKSDKIKFWGSIYNLPYLDTLRFYCRYYFHGHSVGGTNPSLLEAMASYACVIAHDNVFNRTVLNDDALYFQSAEDIAHLLNVPMDDQICRTIKSNNADKIRNQYSWQHIIDSLEKMFINALAKKRA